MLGKPTNQKSINRKYRKCTETGCILITDTIETSLEVQEILQQEEVLRTNRAILIHQLENIDSQLKGIADIKRDHIDIIIVDEA